MVHPGHGAKVTTRLAALRRVGAMAARELALTALLLLGVSLVVFVILHLSPGDPFSVLLEGQAAGGAARASVREALGVPTTWYGRYLAWLGNIARGNLGTSIRTGVPVAGEIARAGPNTLYLTLGSLLVTLLLAVPVALYSASRAAGALARGLRLAVYLVSAVPVFWLGYVVIYLFIHRFGVFPLLSGSGGPARHGWLYGLLPIVVLGVANGTVSEVTRHLRGELGRVLTEDYIRTARAKGAPVWRHAFKEGFLLPMTEMIASKIPFVIGGAIIVEQVFNWPGLGRMVWQAAQDRDFPVIMGIALVAAAFVRIASLLRGVIYAGVNPRAATD
jgi:peptide/nickel transport system permease protein